MCPLWETAWGWRGSILAGVGLSLGVRRLPLGWFRAGKAPDLVCERQIKEVVEGYGLKIGLLAYARCVPDKLLS